MGFLTRLFSRAGDPGHRHSAEDLAALDVTAPGWRAIDRTFDRLHDSKPMHWGTVVRWRTGGPDPLDGISAYRADEPPHWHYVSYGLSELYAKESDDAELSGWGFELTFRLARDPAAAEAPIWAAGMLQNLARYVFESGNVLSPGDHMDLHGPIGPTSGTAIRAVLFAADAQVEPIDTPNGRIAFVQVVGVTIDEYEAACDWSSDPMLDLLAEANPLLVTNLARPSILGSTEVREAVRAGIERDGSAVGGIQVDELDVAADDSRLTIRFGALGLQRVLRLATGRLSHDRSFWVRGPAAAVAIQRGEGLAWHQADDALHLTLDDPTITRLLSELRPVAGHYELDDAGRLAIDVVPTIIRDQHDREIDRIG
ncbi:MAG TPA: suppressor of fused domain protein [Candidatus Limnocylindrales bacterium]